MAHELSIIDGIAEMAYLQSEGNCWHQLGQPIADNATREEWMIASNISNWQINKQKALMMINGAIHLVPNIVHLTRSDNNTVLATVSDQFKIHQPQEVSKWMFDVVDKLGFQMSTMGVLFDGKVFWAQCNVNQSCEIGGIDMINRKLLIRVPNTGKDATTITDTTVRTVCNNTLRMAISNGRNVLKLSHLNAFKAEEVSDMIGLHDLAEWQKIAEAMTRIQVNETTFYELMHKIFRLEDLDENNDDVGALREGRVAIAADNRAAKTCFELFLGKGEGSELATAKGTLWGAINAVTEYVDHKRNTNSWDNRFDQANFGQWANVKDRAWEEALMLAA